MGCGSSQVSSQIIKVKPLSHKNMADMNEPENQMLENRTVIGNIPGDAAPENLEVEEDTDENATEEQNMLKRINEQVPRLLQLETAEDFSNEVNVKEIIYIKNKIAMAKSRKKRIEHYPKLMELKIVELVLKIWKALFKTDFMHSESKSQRNMLRASQVILWNGTHFMKEISLEFFKLEGHVFYLECLSDKRLTEGDYSDVFLLGIARGIFGIMHNLQQQIDEVRTALREHNAVEIVSHYRDKGSTMLQCKALMCLAYLVDEQENEKLISDDKIFKFVLDILRAAIGQPSHHSKRYGYNAEELARVLNLMAANDSNKEKLVSNGLADLYGLMMGGEFNSKEKYHAAKGLYILCFNKNCRETIKANSACMAGLRDVKHADDPALQKAINGALWLIDEKDNERKTSTGDEGEKGHIMISYNWSNQAVLLKVRNVLQDAGYSVWMDVDKMSGNILQAMAEAIENSSVILICFSHKYFESPNCRLEAEYAYQKKKTIIPLKMEYGYDAQGWLGILIGSSLYFDFARENKFNTSIEGLLREIPRKENSLGIVSIKKATIGMTGSAPGSDHQHGSIVTTNKVSNYTSWSAQQVQDWLANINLKKYQSKFSGFDGSLLQELSIMLREAPETYYKTLREDMKFTLINMLVFTREIKKI